MANCYEPRVPKNPNTNSLLATWMYTTTSNNLGCRCRVVGCALTCRQAACKADSGFPFRMKVGPGSVFGPAEHRPSLYRKSVCSSRMTVSSRTWVERAVIDLQ